MVEQVRSHDGTQVLLADHVPDRLVRTGVVPSDVEVARQFLEAHDVPASAIHILPGPARSDWDSARAFRGWLEDHPGERVAVLCDRFHSRRLRILLDRTLGADAGRAHVLALIERRYDESDWWRKKDGLTAAFTSFRGLAYVGLVGEGEPPTPDWDADTYEEGLP